MLAQLGSTVFEGLFSFDDFKKKVGSVYAELPLIGGKPDLQRTGRALDTIKLNIRLHESFCRPDLRYSELESYCNNGDILPFVDGYGSIIGNFVLEDLEQNIIQTDILGSVTHCTCELSLREYVDPNRSVSNSDNAKRNAFALGAKSLTLKVQGPPVSMPSDLFKSIGAVSAGATQATKSVEAANKNPATSQGHINRAIAAVNEVNSAAISLQTKIGDYGSQVHNAASIIATVETLKNSNAALHASLAAGDIATALVNSSALTGSVSQLSIDAQPIQKLLILR